MTKIVVLCLFMINLFAYDLSISREFKDFLEPDRMSISFSLQTKQKKARDVRTTFNPIVLKMKKYAICSGGSYRVNPYYDYQSKSRKLLGYEGYLQFSCKFKKVDELDDVLGLFDSYKEVRVQQNPISWIVDEQTVAVSKQSMELEAIKYSKKYVNILQTESIGKCKVSKIDIQGNSYNRPITRMALKSESLVEEPKKVNIDISLHANYIFECN